MRTNRELISASKGYVQEDRHRSWRETIVTLMGLIFFLSVSFMTPQLGLKILCSIICSLFYVRMFIIYHDYQHHAILQCSVAATLLMKAFGIFILAPQNIWKRSHDHHHTHNSKLTITGIGSYPTICTQRYNSLTRSEQITYLINRHPLTVIFGYLTLFIYWLNIKSFIQSPKKHLDSLIALVLHVGVGMVVFYFSGPVTFFLSWFAPFLLSFGIGSYLFYCQHNFPGAMFSEKEEWNYEYAAINSTSHMVMNPVMQWFTGNIGYHHVHHLNSRIPFYRLPEAMAGIPELQNPITTSWNPIAVWQCFRLKLWDAHRQKMVTLKQR
jgi:omega-6 fatty acid desaturase (delta-12 desaturase)